MAEVADLFLPEEQFADEEEYIETLDTFPFWSRNFDREEFYSSDPNPDPDSFSPHLSEFGLSDLSIHAQTIIDGDDIEEREACFDGLGSNVSDSDSVTDVNLVIDLFERSIERNHVVDNEEFVVNPFADDPFFRVSDENNEIGSNYLELGLGFDRGNGGDYYDDDDGEENGGFMITKCGDEFFVGRRSESGESSVIRSVEPFGDGLRVVENGFDSDDEEEVVVGADLHSRDDNGLDRDRAMDDLGLHLCWDCLRLEDQREYYEEVEFEWEEVDDRVDEREVLSMVIDAEEERSVSVSVSEIQSEEVGEGSREESMRSLEWEVLMAVNNLDRNTELEHEDYIYPAEYEMIVGQFIGNESSLRGSPPTAKSFVENLPSIVLTQDDVQNIMALCAVCKDEISMEEQPKMLPCSHYYHRDCILPWLNIRSTCPVCRFELPTDDPDYERRRNQQVDHGFSEDS